MRFLLLPDSGDPHHEELVHVGAKYRKESQSFQQGVAFTVSFLQHTPLEIQQA